MKVAHPQNFIRILCTNMNANYSYDEFAKSKEECRLKQNMSTANKHFRWDSFELFIKPIEANRVVLDNSLMQIVRLIEYVNLANDHRLAFFHLKGLSLELTLEINAPNTNVYFYNMNFDFYNRDLKNIRTCEDFQNETSTYFIDQQAITFSNVNYGTPICELLFRYAQINTIEFRGLIKSYYKKNLLRFLRVQTNKTELQSIIETARFSDIFGLDLTSDFLSLKIFKETRYFIFDGQINSIQMDLFRNFEQIKILQMNPIYFLDICRKQGLGWLKSINSNININWTDTIKVSEYINFLVYVVMAYEREKYYENTFQFAYDQDFCLFIEFPFNQMITLHTGYTNVDVLNCISEWLIRSSVFIEKHGLFDPFFITVDRTFNKTICDINMIDRRSQLCNKSHFTNKSSHYEETLNFIIVSEFLVILFSPLISLVGIVLNSLIIVVIVNKENRKELKERQYTYMAIHSAINIAICLLNILSLINECQLPFGIYCSSIRKIVFFQYFKIIFGECINSFLRLMSNFSYMAFAFNRVSLVGQDHNFLTKFMADVGIKKYIGASFVISACLSVIKGFRYEINLFQPDAAFPTLFNQNEDDEQWSQKLNNKLILIFNVVYDLVNYVIFILINLLVDVLLIVKLRQALREREEKFKEQSEKVREKMKKENQESIRKVTSMVIVSTSVNLMLKLPIVITSLNDLRLLTVFVADSSFDRRHWFSFPYSMRFFCSSDRICEIFQSFGNFLYLISMSLNFVLLKSYDKKFGLVYEQAFNKSKTTNKK